MLRRFSNIEQLTPTNNPLYGFAPTYGGKTMLSSTDRVLIDNGGSGYRALDVYLSLFLNPIVYKSWDKVMSEICARDIEVKPYDDSEYASEVADDIRKTLLSIGTDFKGVPLLQESLGIDELYRALGVAYITGISPVELVWGLDKDNKKTVKYFKPRDPRLFRMAYDDATGTTKPRLLTRNALYDGEPIPAAKWIFHRYYAVPGDDAYGLGIGRNLYYPVEWHKQLMTYWLMLIDKTVMPSTVGKIEQGAKLKDEDIVEFYEAVRNFGQDSAIVLKPGTSIDIKDMRANNADALKTLSDVLEAYIETIVVGESSTGKDNGASQAKDTVSNGLKLTKAKALSDSISHMLNATLVKWLTWARHGKNAPVPTIWRKFSEDVESEPSTIEEISNIADFVDILARLDQVGVSLDRDYIERRLGAPLKKPKPAPGAPGASTPASPARTGTALYDNVPSPSELLGLS